ncbi:hypothetical protein Acy02nite_00780 [Actinoplanes cyaneus]|uniref:Uncharacterized protein n=1 Tax=Actinoplanes cyaneus TaxID=52696 RepID=A0A919M1A7_9ACTN|nr:hypothetical protein [Actinoplanes cyaneus]MCW2142649.1 hypothetical protein [Actinoplanes cyaneus]GID62197.1 hypothetical protein Acy02nite_00780 [Actinoplanes cyaneus]
MKYWHELFIAGVLAIPLATGTAILYSAGYDQAKAYFVGQPGQVAPFRDCVWVEDGSKDDGWECRGVFTGGGLRIDDVRIRYRPAQRPTGPVPAIVSGPDATAAWTDSGAELLFPAIAGVAVMLISPGLTLHFYRDEIVAGIAGWRRRRQSRRP